MSEEKNTTSANGNTGTEEDVHEESLEPLESKGNKVEAVTRAKVEEILLSGDKTAEESAPSITPEEYGDFSIPEGTSVDNSILSEFKQLAANIGLKKEQAQNLVNLQMKMAQEQANSFDEQRKQWVNEITQDTIFGGENLDKTVQSANQVLRKYDTNGDVASFLSISGFGDNPHIIKFLAQIAKDTVREDNLSTTGINTNKTIPLAERLWPD